MKKLIILTIVIITILSSCKKEEINPKDYPFFCRVDGEIWTSTFDGWCPHCFPLKANYYPNGSILSKPGKLEIRATREIADMEISQSMYIVVYGLLKEGNHLDSLRIQDIYHDYNEPCPSISGHALDTNYMNTFFVSDLDTIKKRIAGTFEIQVINKRCTPPDTIKITDGHFDLNPTWHP